MTRLAYSTFYDSSALGSVRSLDWSFHVRLALGLSQCLLCGRGRYSWYALIAAFQIRLRPAAFDPVALNLSILRLRADFAVAFSVNENTF